MVSPRNMASTQHGRAGPLQGLHLLLTEDHPDQKRVYAQILLGAGAEVTLECSGDAAIATVANASHPFDGILIDLRMPGISGIQATQRLREQGFSGSIIAMTAYHDPQIEQRWFLAGCNAYLQKPLTEKTLITSVQTYCRSKLTKPIAPIHHTH